MAKRVTMFVQNSVTMDNRVVKEARVLRDAGWQVTIVGKKTSPELAARENFEGIAILRVGGDQKLRTDVDGVYQRGRQLLLDAYIGMQVTTRWPKLTSRWPKIKERLSRLTDEGGKKYFYTPSTEAWASAYLRLMRLLTDVEPATHLIDWDRAVASVEPDILADVWHAHDIDTVPTALRLRTKYGGKVIYDAHEYWLDCNNVYTRFEAQAYELLERFSIRRADAVITVSGSIAELLAKKYKVDRPSVVLNTPEHRNFTANDTLRSKLGIGADAFVMVYVGLITHQRGYEQMIDALSKVRDGVLVCLGPGDSAYIETLRSRAVANGVGQQVIFAAAVKPDEIQPLISSADVGVVVVQRGAISYNYSLPSKFFECLFAGLPVAVSDLVEMRTLVEKFDLGVTFDERDAASIAAALEQLRSRMADFTGERWNRRRAQMAAEYAWGTHSRVLIDLYDKLVTA